MATGWIPYVVLTIMYTSEQLPKPAELSSDLQCSST
jgi:hypothetical protein